MIRSAWLVSQVNVGFDRSHLLIAEVSLPRKRYGSSEDSKSTFRRILEETQRLPGVETAAMASNVPLKRSEHEWPHTGRPAAGRSVGHKQPL